MSESEVNFKTYPPIFRQLNRQTGQDADAVVDINKVSDSDPLPVIDLQCLNVDHLGEVCRDWGVFRLVNHGVPPALLSQLREHTKKLFSLPFETKQALFTSPFSYFWGTAALTPSGAALPIGPQNINWVEGLNIPLAHLSQLQLQAEDPVFASFRALLDEYGKHLVRLAMTVFEAMATRLGLDPAQSKSNLSESTGFIRVYRYPLCSMANSAWGLDVHTDSSVLSILNEYEVGGLEVLKDDEWLQVKSISNTFIANLGDMMQAMSNDEYKSCKHRVRLNEHSERISLCYFVFPEECSVIRSSKYKPFSYSEFRAQVQQDIKTLGYKVGLERFKLTEASS